MSCLCPSLAHQFIRLIRIFKLDADIIFSDNFHRSQSKVGICESKHYAKQLCLPHEIVSKKKKNLCYKSNWREMKEMQKSPHIQLCKLSGSAGHSFYIMYYLNACCRYLLSCCHQCARKIHAIQRSILYLYIYRVYSVLYVVYIVKVNDAVYVTRQLPDNDVSSQAFFSLLLYSWYIKNAFFFFGSSCC